MIRVRIRIYGNICGTHARNTGESRRKWPGGSRSSRMGKRLNFLASRRVENYESGRMEKRKSHTCPQLSLSLSLSVSVSALFTAHITQRRQQNKNSENSKGNKKKKKWTWRKIQARRWSPTLPQARRMPGGENQFSTSLCFSLSLNNLVSMFSKSKIEPVRTIHSYSRISHKRIFGRREGSKLRCRSGQLDYWQLCAACRACLQHFYCYASAMPLIACPPRNSSPTSGCPKLISEEQD